MLHGGEGAAGAIIKERKIGLMEYIAVALSALGLLTSLLVLISVRKAAGEKNTEELARLLREEAGRINAASSQQSSQLRQEIQQVLSEQNRQTREAAAEQERRLHERLQGFAESSERRETNTERRLADMRQTMEENMEKLRRENGEKLEAMRATVDEKLHETLEKRLGESFSQVSKQLEQVYKSLGEMQTLSTGVADLQKMLSNVKTRGTWGEISLQALLEQLLSPQQFKRNVKVRPRSGEIVEFAIVLPGKEDGDQPVYLPIDSKFPVEAYLRMTDAEQKADAGAAERARRELLNAVKESARTIRDKYIAPPYTTDFAIMYLPTEGLYAAVTRESELCAQMQREYRITVMGPATIGAFLNSLQMGFQTLAIQKRSSEVWRVLGAVKKEFGTFADLLEKTQKHLEAVSGDIEKVTKRSQQIQNRLRNVEELPEQAAEELLEASDTTEAGGNEGF